MKTHYVTKKNTVSWTIVHRLQNLLICRILTGTKVMNLPIHIIFSQVEHDISNIVSQNSLGFEEREKKCTLVQALRFCTGRTAHRGSTGIALLFLYHGTRRGWGVSVTPRPLFTPGKDPVPNAQEAGWAPGPVWTGAENLAPTGIRSPDRPARSQSLYWLSYRGPYLKRKYKQNFEFGKSNSDYFCLFVSTSYWSLSQSFRLFARLSVWL